MTFIGQTCHLRFVPRNPKLPHNSARYIILSHMVLINYHQIIDIAELGSRLQIDFER